jgi:hypothetical protein
MDKQRDLRRGFQILVAEMLEPTTTATSKLTAPPDWADSPAQQLVLSSVENGVYNTPVDL